MIVRRTSTRGAAAPFPEHHRSLCHSSLRYDHRGRDNGALSADMPVIMVSRPLGTNHWSVGRRQRNVRSLSMAVMPALLASRLAAASVGVDSAHSSSDLPSITHKCEARCRLERNGLAVRLTRTQLSPGNNGGTATGLDISQSAQVPSQPTGEYGDDRDEYPVWRVLRESGAVKPRRRRDRRMDP